MFGWFRKKKPTISIDDKEVEGLSPEEYQYMCLNIYDSMHWRTLRLTVAILEKQIVTTLVHPTTAGKGEIKDQLHGGIYWLKEILSQIERVAKHKLKEEAKKKKREERKKKHKLRSRKLEVPIGTN